MFTGLVEAVGEIVECKPTSGGVRLRIEAALAAELAPGDSVAVNGVCLTVIVSEAGQIHADVGPETLRVTTLGVLPLGSAVNLERPLRADGRIGVGYFLTLGQSRFGYVPVLSSRHAKHQRALQITRTVQPRREQEVSGKQRFILFKNFQDFFSCHNFGQPECNDKENVERC